MYFLIWSDEMFYNSKYHKHIDNRFQVYLIQTKKSRFDVGLRGQVHCSKFCWPQNLGFFEIFPYPTLVKVTSCFSYYF